MPEAKKLKERVKDVVPLRKKSTRVPVRVKRSGEHYMDPVMDLRRAGNRLLDSVFRELDRPLSPWTDPFALPADLFQTGWPPVDISETDEKIQVKAELPGLRKDEIEVSLSGNSLTIRGEKSYREEKKNWNNYLLECSYGSFQRTIPLPGEVEPGKTKAIHKDGVLTVTLPKTSAARKRMRRIKVKSG
jgi:HSP20 family protein